MFLKSLEIQGFKSFPDKTMLKFGKGITAVVGPNGSGKSNISDAIRWVLGEMSAKTLRGSRMEDVIFGGTVQRQPQGLAQVTLTIDNTLRELPFDGDEIAVTRRYYRSGESEYLLNGKEVRLRDIYELFMDTGLGREGYSIIGQGRIAEIVSAKSEDRREIFEEAAGIAKYRYHKEESERRLAAAEENLTRLRDILGELASRVGPLKEQSEKAKRYIELAGEKKKLEVGLWLYALDRQRESLREHDNRLGFARAQYGQTEERMKAVSAAIEEAYLEAQKAAAEAESLRDSAKADEEAASKNAAAADVIDNDIVHIEENIARIRAEIERVGATGEQDRAEAERRREELRQRTEAFEALKSELAAAEKEAEELARRSERLFGSLDAAAAALSALNVKDAAIRYDKNAALSSAAQVTERISAIDADCSGRLQRQAQAEKALEDCERKLKETGDRAQALSNILKGYELKAGARREKLRGLEERVREISMKEREKRQRADMLAELERQMEGFSQSVRRVMRERSRLGGIEGPVSRLIRVDGRYAVAIDTALGAAAQHIVVDNEESAKAAIAFLKSCDGGRATFLPLSSVRGGELSEQGLAACPGYVGLAHRLVEYDPRYEGVVKNLLGHTVVATDLDSAVDIARRFHYRFRIVTLDGQVVNAGGSLTGGSTGKGAGLLSRAGEIERLGAEAKALHEALEKAEAERKAAAAEAASMDAAISGARGELVTAQEEAIRLEGEKKRLDEQLASLKADIESLKAEKALCLERLSEFQAAAARADERLAENAKETARVSAELERLGYDKSRLAALRDQKTEHLNNLRLESLACEKDIEAARRQIAELERRLSDRGGQVEALKAQIAQHEARRDEALERARELREKAVQLRQKAAQSLQKAADKNREREEIEKRSVELRAQERALSEEKERFSRELARLEERRNAAQTEYDGLISRLWEEYELTRSEAEKTAERITDPAGAQKRLNAVKQAIKELGDVNVGAIDEYREVSQRYEFLSKQVEDVEKSRAELLSLIDELTSKMREIFSARFEEINREFSETFTELFGGGSARLALSEPEDVLQSGIEIIVQPPGKIIKNLSALSGGEQSFVAIALYFAILKVRPSPFCVLDEIEAALDDANVTRFANYLRRMSRDTQFIVITHRRVTMNEADILYGVTMQDEGVSKLLALNVDELVSRLGVRA